MWNIKKPDISEVRKHLDTLFPDKKTKDTLESLYKEYEESNGRPNSAWYVAGLTEDERKSILTAYSEVSETGKLSVLRSALKLAIDECPYCGFGEIRDLDHHLQKAYFNCFSIYPLNLIPSCSKCNGHKPRKPRLDPNKHHIHAYLEDVSKLRFLVAKIKLSKKALTVEFRISHTARLNIELFNRLSQHLKDFHLNERYSAQVNIFLSEQKTAIAFTYKQGGENNLKEYLKCSAKANEEAFGVNDWRVALLWALSRSSKFYKGGFKDVLGY